MSGFESVQTADGGVEKYAWFIESASLYLTTMPIRNELAEIFGRS